MMWFARPTLALAFGAFILCAETCLHFQDVLSATSWLDLPLYDWIAGAFLLTSGVVGRRDRGKGRALQAAAWGFMCSLLIGALEGHLEEAAVATRSEEWISARGFLVILAGLLALSVFALVATLTTDRDQRP